MASPLTADRIQEITPSIGTGTINLGGATTGFRTFASTFSSGNIVYYCLTDGTNWEVGNGTFTSGGPSTLTRTNVLSSSNNNTLVDFPGPTTSVFNTAPASMLAAMVNLTDPQTLTNKTITTRVSYAGGLASFAPVCDTTDILIYDVTQAVLFLNPVYTIAPTDGQGLIIRMHNSSVSTRGLVWDTSYRPIGLTMPAQILTHKML